MIVILIVSVLMEGGAMASCLAARTTGGNQETLGHRAVNGLYGFKKRH